MRKSDAFLLVTAINLLFFLASLFTLPRLLRPGDDEEQAELVKRLCLTDLCMFTEASYTRHPALADLHTPFQDHPSALEHFPTGSILPVPRTLHDYLDDAAPKHP